MEERKVIEVVVMVVQVVEKMMKAAVKTRIAFDEILKVDRSDYDYSCDSEL